MRYYLETNALIGLSSHLHELGGKDIFTSSLSIFELISGITEDTYQRRKTILKKVIDSGVIINWDTFKDKLTKPFTDAYSDPERDNYSKMTKIVLESNSFEEIDELCVSKNESFRLESFTELDSEISKEGKKEVDKGIEYYEGKHSKESKKELKKK